MNYLKNLAINFLVIFFANHILPGIQVANAKLPQIGRDLIFAFVLGLLNSMIYPALKIFRQEISGLKIGMVSLILNFAAYGVVKLIPFGVNVITVEGYILASAIVTIGSFFTNFFEMKRHRFQSPPDHPLNRE